MKATIPGLKSEIPLMVLHTEWSQGWGGQEMRVLMEAELLNERGFNSVIVCQPDSPLAKEAKKKGVEVVELKIRGSFDLIAIYKLYRLLKIRKINVINTHSSPDSWVGFFASRIAGIPVLVRTRHLSTPVSKNPFNFIYNMPDAIITTATAIKNMLISEKGIPSERVFSVPTGVNLKRFTPSSPSFDIEDLRKSIGINGRGQVISTVSILRNWKGHRYLLDAIEGVLKRYGRINLLIVGDGPQRRNIESLIREKGLGSCVLMLGYREDIPEILKMTDIFVMASTSYEGVPQALLQAMAVGVPVVATDVGGIREVVENLKTGILVRPCDPEALSKGIIYLLENPKKAKEMAYSGRKVVEKNYSVGVMMDRIVKIYTDLLKEKLGQGLK